VPEYCSTCDVALAKIRIKFKPVKTELYLDQPKPPASHLFPSTLSELTVIG